MTEHPGAGRTTSSLSDRRGSLGLSTVQAERARKLEVEDREPKRATAGAGSHTEAENYAMVHVRMV
jgi:hypothetical protein